MSSRLFGLIPAAGLGARLGQPVRKQYSLIGNKTMLAHSVDALLAVPELVTVFVVLSPEDETFRRLDWSDRGDRLAPLYCGGATRRDSVLNGLIAASAQIDPNDWVLVHDAARPCVSVLDLRRLIEAVLRIDTGGLLALRVADTLKRGNSQGRIVATESRENLWQAQTPQMFRHGMLLRALHTAREATDESSAIEKLGEKPQLIEGSARNLKVTYADDLQLAATILAAARQ
ncbi:MAG: 2-C-methyl-D-erythritol 4-phosphate cytidylyltransferase [Burkholderiales bacterium]